MTPTLFFPEGTSMLVRAEEWAESNQVFFQAGPSVPLEQDRGQGGECNYREKVEL